MKKIKLLALATLSFALPSLGQKLVLPGDYPDPSVVKIGDTYWASATTSNWMPAFPLLKSKDLVHWTTEGHVFNALPAWADYYFWAPEISYENGKTYIYYSAHKKGGNLCVGIASADRPEGPYRDHGPIVCDSVGSIDGFPMRDEAGKLQLIWKEDGNSVGKPTPIWMQELNEERTALVGTRKELFRNDQPWEGNLVEGVSIIRHGSYFYAFYSAAACCGNGCNYKTGVARSKTLAGPWEKYAANPLLHNEGPWKCMGHGTPVEKEGRYYFMYHAYDTAGAVFTGREGLLQEFRFTEDGWIEFIKDRVPMTPAAERSLVPVKGNPSLNWQWSVFQQADRKIKGSKIELGALPQGAGSIVGQKTNSLDYDATVKVKRSRSTAMAGLGLLGDERNAISALVKGDTVYLSLVRNNKDSVLLAQGIPKRGSLYLQMQVRNGKDVNFFYSRNGRKFTRLNTQPIFGAGLPPWDRALRAGVVAKGAEGTKGVFRKFSLRTVTP